MSARRLAVVGFAALVVAAGAHAAPAAAFVDRMPADVLAPVAAIVTPDAMPVTGAVSVTFSQAVTGVSATSLRLVPAGGSAAVPATVAVPSATSATITPRAPLVAGQRYGLAVTGAITNSMGASAVAAPRQVRTTTVLTPGSRGIVATWDPDVNRKAFGGGYEKTATLGDTSTVAFSGTSISLYGLKTARGGYAHVYIDGVYEATASFYAPTTQWRARIWSEALVAGPHVVTLIARGLHESASRGDWVYVDQWVAGATPYQEAGGDPTGTVLHAWNARAATDARNGYAATESMDRRYLSGGYPQASARVAGTAVGVRFCRSPAGGYAHVSLNGAKALAVNLYQAYTACGYLGFTGQLRAGVNTVTVYAAGLVPAGSRGSEVALDSISIS